MDVKLEFIMACIGVVILLAWYFVGKMDNIIGKIFRVIWNFWFKLFALIPLMGWTSHFIITMNAEDEINKERFQEYAADVRRDVAQQIEESAQQKATESARKEAEWQENQRQQLEREQESIRKQAWQNEGRNDVQFSEDGKRWKYSDEDWRDGRNV